MALQEAWLDVFQIDLNWFNLEEQDVRELILSLAEYPK